MRRLGTSRDLVGVRFESAVAPGLPFAAVQRLARLTLEANPRAGLTGELRLEAGRFAQRLEGPAGVILPLVARIFGDPRPQAIRVHHLGAIAARSFPNWRILGYDAGESPAVAAGLRSEPPPLRLLASAGHPAA